MADQQGTDALVFEDGEGRLIAIPREALDRFVVPPERVSEVRAALDDDEDEVVGFNFDDEEEVQMIGTQSFNSMGTGGFSMGTGRAVPVVNSYQRLPGLDPTGGFKLF
jgi:hypothetical protein